MGEMYSIVFSEDKIEHHGVLGMKWGIRRYQPYSVVPRKSGKTGEELGEAKKQPIHEDYKRVHDRKSVKLMSDQELRSRVNRLNMEKQYKELSNSSIDNGRKTVHRLLGDINTAKQVVKLIDALAPI